MLPKKNRLTSNQVKKIHGDKIYGHYHLAIYAESQQPHDRYACTISKKTHSLATARNRLKRQLYSIIDPYKNKPPFFDIVWILNQKSTIISYEDLKLDVQTTLTKLKKTQPPR